MNLGKPLTSQALAMQVCEKGKNGVLTFLKNGKLDWQNGKLSEILKDLAGLIKNDQSKQFWILQKDALLRDYKDGKTRPESARAFERGRPLRNDNKTFAFYLNSKRLSFLYI